jgi:hypothetical protein
MKTFKTTTILVGVFVALISLTAHGADKNKSKKSAEEKQAILDNMGINKALEIALITEYLDGLEEPETLLPKQIKIYNMNDELLYEGDPDTEKASELKIKADFLMEHDNVSYYMIML